MNTHKQVKQMIASVAGGEWVPDRINKPQLHHIVCEMFGGVVSVQDSHYHSVISIKANEVK